MRWLRLKGCLFGCHGLSKRQIDMSVELPYRMATHQNYIFLKMSGRETLTPTYWLLGYIPVIFTAHKMVFMVWWWGVIRPHKQIHCGLAASSNWQAQMSWIISLDRIHITLDKHTYLCLVSCTPGGCCSHKTEMTDGPSSHLIYRKWRDPLTPLQQTAGLASKGFVLIVN